MTYILQTLPYRYDALSPIISEQTLMLHHNKHHAAYVNNLNTLLSDNAVNNNLTIEEFIQTIDDLKINNETKQKIIFNAGGHYNHQFFWEILQHQSSQQIPQNLIDAINISFGNFDTFKDAFKSCAMAHMGSGWAWLCYDSEAKLSQQRLFIRSTLNHDSPIMNHISGKHGTPLLVLDMWEHAYYLQYQNRKAEYIDAFWDIVNWNKVAEHLNNSMKK